MTLTSLTSKWEVETENGYLFVTAEKKGELLEVFIPYIGHWTVPSRDTRTTIGELVASLGYTAKYIGERSLT